MASKTIESAKSSVKISNAGGTVLVEIYTPAERAGIFLAEDQAHEVAEAIKAFATIISSQESDRC